jgi:uncharacterized protein
MNAFMLICWDDPNNLSARKSVREVHLKHIDTVKDHIMIAGPFKNEIGEMIGSLLIIKAETKEEAEFFLKQDPYYQKGVWVKWQIEAFTPAAGLWSMALNS